ncbi:peptidoglycan DD-metalloendopeptidase family protein [Mucilaginibacter sp. PAMB04274]|uniref:peptidoglycan DD-metalloendopeptidase family protein n=1 Tax=Mucilaginibacter sp. PAMB04274 TaxID=3138568 RepID=UPI0031F63470
MKNYSACLFLIFLTAMLCCSCSKRGPLALFNKLSPHDAYAQRLKDAGLERSAMGSAWLQKGQLSVSNPLNISIPYKETGYFSAEKIPVTALRFDARRGQKLNISLTKKPQTNFSIYIDLLQEQSATEQKVLASADTSGRSLEYEVKENGKYVLRLQPELLRSGEYTLTITSGPSLSFPVSSSGKPHIGSFWGDGRDNGGRRHEGVDIFATKHTPAIAAANGTVTKVTENTLGGLVVFMHPDNRDYTLYYAHLDKQLVQDGQTVRIGDTLGLVGNTGNARTTPPHLHFGIYTNGGAIDPLIFVDREVKSPPPIKASLTLLNATARTTARNNALHIEPTDKALTRQSVPISTPLTLEAATDGWYKATLPDGTQGYIQSRNVTTATATLRRITLNQARPLLDAPDSATAARKATLANGTQVAIRGSFKNYYLITDDNENTGWINMKIE